MKSFGFLALIAILLAGSLQAFTQTQPNLENGFKPYGSYDGGDLDHINLQNGNLIVHIPMPFTYPQRGNRLAPENVLRLSSKSWAVTVNALPNDPNVQQFWALGFGPAANIAQFGTGLGLDHTLDLSLHRNLQTETDAGTQTFGYYLTTWDGGLHQLAAPSNAPLDPNGNAMSFDTIDASSYHVDLSNVDSQSGVPGSAVVIDRAGNRYQIAGWATWCGKPVNAGSVTLPYMPYDNQAEQQLESEMTATEQAVGVDLDPFGSFKHEPLQDTGPIGSSGGTSVTTCQQASRTGTITDLNGNTLNSFWTSTSADTVGRPLEGVTSATQTSDYTGCISPNAIPITSAYIYNYPGVGGANNQIKACWGTFPISTNFGVSGVIEYQDESASMNNGTTAAELLTTVILSDAPNWTGTRWTFNYDGYFNPTDISLPTGGSIHYDWATISQPNCGTRTPVSRAVAARTVRENNGNSFKWTYQWGTASGGVITNIVTDPLSNDTLHVFSSLDGPNGCLLYETSTRRYQGSSGSGTLLRQVDTTYSTPVSFNVSGSDAFGGLGNIVPISIRTTIPENGGNKVSLVTRSYDSGPGNGRPIFGNITSERVYDWGAGAPGPLLRETDTILQWQADSTGNYVIAHDIDAPASIVTKDGSGNRVAETDYTYDESAYLTSSGISSQHGPAPGPVRSNPTTVSKWLNTTNSLISGHSNWYDTGELYKAIDPLGYTTTHTYSSSFAGAYPTQTCNALSQCVSGNYDFNTGLLTSFTDANGNTSNYSYDLMSRLTLAQFPADPSGNRPQTSFTYSQPNSFPLSVQRTRSTTASLSDVATTYFDGLGRPYETQHATPNGNATVVTTYDALDHPIRVTNPYFSTSDPTYGVIQTQYDALGRVTQTTKQDNTVLAASYDQTSANSVNGDCTLATDEAGNTRKSCVDGLGRLIEVDEPQASSGSMSTSYVTLYQYDALSNLLCVHQKATDTSADVACTGGTPPSVPASWRQRFFTYDSLSRLLTAINPESGQITYSYDANGNVLQKTSPAPNQTGSATQTISYCYDKLNRVTGKAYSAQSCPVSSPVVTYTYDSGTNGIGHLTSLTDQPGSGSYSYDALGRITAENRTIAGIQKSLSYTYNLDGSVATLTYPSGAVVTYTPDAAGRMLSAVDSANNINYVTGSGGPGSGAAYGPDGSILSFNQGWTTSFDGIANTFSYNPRLQPVNMAATSPGTTGTDSSASVTIGGNWQGGAIALAGASAGMTGFAISDSEHLYYLGSDGHVHQLWWTGSEWLDQDLTAQTGGVSAATDGSGMAGFPSGGNQMVCYVGSDRHIHQKLWQGNGWLDQDLTAWTGGPTAAAGTGMSNLDTSDGQQHMYYVGSDQHVHQLQWTGSTWMDQDLTAQTGGVAAAAGGNGVSGLASGTNQMVGYAGSDRHIHQKLWQGNGWTDQDLTAWSGGPLTANVTSVANTSDSNGQHVQYSGTDQHLHQLWWTGTTWVDQDLTNAGSGPLVASGSGIAGSTDSNGQHVEYSGSDQHLHQLWWTGSRWEDQDLTNDGGGPLVAGSSGIAGFDDGYGQHVFYEGNDEHIHQLWWTGSNWTGQDISYLASYAVGVADAGTVSLTVGSFTAMTCFGSSTNPACSGRPVNTTTSQVASTLASALNASGSPVTAAASGATINMTWKATGPFTTPVSALSTTHDSPNLFPGPSFTSNAANFGGGTGANLSVFSLTYNFNLGNGDNGNVIGITNNRDTTRSQSFTYDYLNRLTSAQNAGTNCSQMTANGKTEYWGNSYGYDAWGNLLQKNVTKCSAENLSVTALSNNQLSGYGYDAAGNMTHDSSTNLNYTFDAENRITGAAGYTYTYDADGNRVEKSNGSTGTVYWYMSPGIVAESDLSGNLKSEYVFFGGERVARKDFSGGTTSVAYYFSDHLKTASVITNSAGVITEDEDYYPWGGELQIVNSDSNHYKFTGKERDSETGLDYFGARYYGNWYGRFLTPDWAAKPITVPYANFGNPQSLNLYSYVQNNPTTLGDPDGHQCEICQIIAQKIRDWAAEGIAAEGGKQFIKDTGIGVFKGAGTSVVNTLKMGAAGSNPMGAVSIMMQPNPKALQPSNQVQAGASTGTQIAVGVVSIVVPAASASAPVTGAAASTEATLTQLATQAADMVGPGSGPAYGTAVHSKFADLVEGLGNSNLSAEVSYKGGQVVDYGTPGSIRVDVAEGRVDAPTAVYDLKTGNATLTPSRTQQIQNQLPGGSNVPVNQIKPNQP